MPNWKKVITSGSDAALRTLEVSNRFIANGTGSLNLSGSFVFTGSVIASSFTGSLQGTGSWAVSASSAVYALTASHALNVSPPVTINNNTDNFVVTATGTSATVQGEPNLRFDGSVLTLTGSMLISGSDVDLTVSGTVAAYGGGFVGDLIGTASWSQVTRRISVGVLGSLKDTDLSNGADDDYYILMMRESGVGFNESLVLTTTSSMLYSASLGLLYVTASWAYTASNAVTASYALNAVQTSPQGNISEIQYNVDGTNFGGVSSLTYDGATVTATDIVATGKFDGNLRLGLFRGVPTNVPAITGKGDEVLVYSQYIPAGTFTDDDVIRVYYRVSNQTNDSAKFRIYLATTSDFSVISGSLTNLIAESAITFSTQYFVMKRDLVTNATAGRIYFANSGSSAVNITTDDVASNAPMSSFVMDWNNTDYYMFFSALPGSITHNSKANGFTIERV